MRASRNSAGLLAALLLAAAPVGLASAELLGSARDPGAPPAGVDGTLWSALVPADNPPSLPPTPRETARRPGSVCSMPTRCGGPMQRTRLARVEMAFAISPDFKT